MLTFFSTAKPFSGHSDVIQRNALQSWKLLHPDVEVILFGDEEGAAEVCAQLGLRHERQVARHESGMKYLNHMFERAQKIARHDFLCYSNCDIILMNDFRNTFAKVLEWRNRFLLISRRWDTDVTEPIDFTRTDWQERLSRLARSTGFLQIRDFVDYFVFPKGLYDYVPPLVVGRSYWDWWLVWKAISSGAAVVDCTQSVVVVHQNHGYGYHPQGKLGTTEDALAARNIHLAGNGKHLRNLEDSTHILLRSGVVIPTPLRKYFHSIPRAIRRNAFHVFVHKTLAIRKMLGLRRESLRKLWAISGWK